MINSNKKSNSIIITEYQTTMQLELKLMLWRFMMMTQIEVTENQLILNWDLKIKIKTKIMIAVMTLKIKYTQLMLNKQTKIWNLMSTTLMAMKPKQERKMLLLNLSNRCCQLNTKINNHQKRL